MLRYLLGFDLHKSNARLLLLSKFLYPKAADDFAEAENWKAVLGESPKQTIRRFTGKGMLAQASLNYQLDYRFKATELKAMLKQRSLPVSGRKEEMINRLIQADPEGMKSAVVGMTVLLCSEYGREVAEQYLSTEKTKRTKLEAQVLEYLRQHKFKEASVDVAAYEADQVFPRGIGIDWKQYNPARDIEMLKAIFDSKPRILSRLNENQLAALRLAAGMMSLFGTNQGKR